MKQDISFHGDQFWFHRSVLRGFLVNGDLWLSGAS